MIFSYITSIETSRKAQKTAQIIAETRALAIDIRLKERYGYVEIFHKPNAEYTYETKFPVQPLYDEIDQGYENAVLSPNHPKYQEIANFADQSAVEAGLAFANGSSAENEGVEKLLQVKPENICINVISLPDVKLERRHLECGPVTSPDGTTIEKIQTKNDVPIYGSQHRLNGYSGSESSVQNTIQNYNFVFVLLTYQEETFFYKTIQKFAHGSDETKWTPPPIKTVWAVAYPQVDFCSGEEC